ncbi:hypothetical protein GGP41_000902 [Bipolaris sorokiniana]|uniref:Uncharacterized protein n=1 Tax=Cochliobolus sativus TaxID=45130 RepID=A0A8H6DYA3_COCSA|nr:hypothetical protein GGP41_000902 [Bipolaris sorokiniana]
MAASHGTRRPSPVVWPVGRHHPSRLQVQVQVQQWWRPRRRSGTPFPNTGQADPQTLELPLYCCLVAPKHTRLTALLSTRLVPHVLLLPSRVCLPPIVLSIPSKARLASMPILVLVLVLVVITTLVAALAVHMHERCLSWLQSPPLITSTINTVWLLIIACYSTRRVHF